uniref:Uncharacterized protein n=3 Tax=Cacopsylla melanoneura TaxID=428564 RepID=A0A8D8V4L2_9HEMI
MLKTLTLTLLCSQLSVNSLEPEHFISHLLSNLKDDILHLKPGSNKTYILNSKLLGRNDSIELDIKSRTKSAKGDSAKDDKETVHEIKSDKDNVHEHDHKVGRHKHFRKHEAMKKHEKLRRHHKLREEMLKEIEDIRDKNDEKIRALMKHKQHEGGRKKIRIKVIRKHKEERGDKVANKTKGETKADKPKVKIIKTLRFHYIPRTRLKAKRKRIVAGVSQYGEPDWDNEGGQIPELHAGLDYDNEEMSAMFRNKKDVEVFERTLTTPTTTTTDSTTPDMKDEYTYEYVYEDELEKGKTPLMKSKQGSGDKVKGATSNEYTYEYIYEDEMKKASPSVSTHSRHTTAATTTVHTTLTESDDDSSFDFHHNDDLAGVTGSGVREPVKLSPSVEKEVRALQALEEKYRTPLDSDVLYGDSNSQYKEPERFKTEHYDEDYMAHSSQSLEYDLFAPLPTTTEKKYLLAASSIMYDDENTEEFLAKRNETKRERGWDSHPADMFFTIAYDDFRPRYTRPSITPEDYEKYDDVISLWKNDKEHNIGDNVHHWNETSTRHPFMQTNRFNVTKRHVQHNMTMNHRVEFKQFNLNEFLQNATNLWMKNVTTQSTTSSKTEDDEMLVTMDGENLYHIPQYQPYRKLRRHKRDIGGGMKMPRRQYEILMYLFQKVNHTRWVAKLKKMRNAPNLMEMLIKRDKKKTNKHSNRYKLKAAKPKKRPKGPKRVVFKKRKPKEDRRKVRVQLAAKRRRTKQAKSRRRRSADNELDINQDDIVENNKYIDIEALHNIEKRNVDNAFNNGETANEDVLVRNKRAVDKVSDDLLHDFEQMGPQQMQAHEGIAEQTEPNITQATESVNNLTREMTPKPRTDPRLWMTDSLLKEIHKRDTLFFYWKYQDRDNPDARAAYMKQRNICNRLLVKAKNEYTKNLYYRGTEQIDEVAAVRRMQKKRLNDEMKILLKKLKCPHCQMFYHENETESEEFNLKITRSAYQFVTKMIHGPNNSTAVLSGKHKPHDE